MGILHTVNKSPFSHSTLASCLEVCGKDDCILLLEDGVLGAMQSSPCNQQLILAIQQGVKIYALSSDIKARGLSEKLLPDIQATDYNGFVRLSIEHRCVQSWY